MSTIRIICQEIDCGSAANVGGPVVVINKTFDVAATLELSEWLNKKPSIYHNRTVTGVEIRESST